ncbi:MAG: sulfatase-like hydrolase/transferase, partial [Flavobacteriaceae bacterium]
MRLLRFKFQTAKVIILALFYCKLNSFAQYKTATPNIILIIVDDLRPELGVYGNNIIKTPHIDALAQDGMIFKNAYCNVPVCGASRASMLTGLRPNNNRFLTFKTKISEDAPNATTFPKLLKSKGYNTFSYNKVAHHKYDAKGSWNQEWYPYLKNETVKASFIGWKDYQLQANRIALINNKPTAVSEKVDGDDSIYFDGQTTQKVISDLNNIQNSSTPFFMAVGYVKPHLPFNAPSKYWDLYLENDIILPVNH